jgi:hypothetical protein
MMNSIISYTFASVVRFKCVFESTRILNSSQYRNSKMRIINKSGVKCVTVANMIQIPQKP